MAATLGQVKSTKNATRTTCILAATLAANGAPSGATAGVPVYPDNANYNTDQGICYANQPAGVAVVFVNSTAGSGTMAATLRLWGYHSASACWYPVGTGADATKGQLNAVASIGESVSDGIRHAESFYLLGLFDRVYLEVMTISGTGTTLEAWITTARGVN